MGERSGAPSGFSPSSIVISKPPVAVELPQPDVSANRDAPHSVVKYETRPCRTALNLRMRARNVGEMCAGEMDDLQGDNDAEERWKEACRREEPIRDLLSRNPDGLKGRDVADLAWELGLSRATAYRMIRLFRAGGTVTSLMDRTRGRREGFRTLDKEREEIIRQAIAGFYLKPTRPPFSKLCRQILVSCEKAGLQPPNRRTIKARVEDVDLQTRGRRRGKQRSSKRQRQRPATTARLAPSRLSKSIIQRSTLSSSTRKHANPLVGLG